MSDTLAAPGWTPNYPAAACNENGPWPQTLTLLLQSYPNSARPAMTLDITCSGMTLTVDIDGGQPTALYVVTPGDGSGTYPQVNTDTNGDGSTTYDYSSEGQYTVTVAHDRNGEQIVVARLDVWAVAP